MFQVTHFSQNQFPSMDQYETVALYDICKKLFSTKTALQVNEREIHENIEV